ncbi:MAG: hypothetical protein KIT83_14130 [Bryobacterales bacterium]|nr:hypothetical protein [Bryobacterales bacterium]
MELDTRQRTEIRRIFGRMERAIGLESLIDPASCEWPSVAPAIATGIPELNRAIGLEGLPRGHIVELFGPEQSGKSTLALRLIAGAQASRNTAAYIDAAHQLDSVCALTLGVNGEDLLLSHPTDAEQALGIIEVLVCSNAVDLVVVDAVSALIPRAELAAPVTSGSTSGTSFALLRALQRLRPRVSRSRCCILFIDQLRERHEYPFGYPETTAGARTLSPFSSIRLILGTPDRRTGRPRTLELRVAKNRLGPMWRTAEIPWKG